MFSGDFAIPLAKIKPYTHRPLKDRKKRPSKKQRSEAGSMGLEDLDVVVYNVGSGPTKASASSDPRRKDKGILIESPLKKVDAAAPMESVEASEAVDGSEARRSEKRKDREDDRRRSGSGSKRSKKEKRKGKGLVASEDVSMERPFEERPAEEPVGEQTAVGASLTFGDDYDFNLRFSGRGRHILEDAAACGEYVRCIQGHPRGPVPEPDEMVERDEFLAFSVDLTRMVSNVNFMRSRYEGMLQKNHELIVENRGLKSRMKNMTIAAEERVGRILSLEEKNEELKVEVAKWEDEVQSMMGEKQSIYHLAKSQIKRLRASRSDTATNFGEYAIEKVCTELREKVEAKFEKIRRHIADSKKMNHISSTVGQIKAFLSFYEQQGSAPEGAVERLQEDLEKYLKMAAAHDVEKLSEEDFTFPDRASWIPGEELVFPIDTPNRIGQYGLGEEWDSAGEEEAREDGEADPRPSRVVLKVGGSEPTAFVHDREREDGSGSSNLSETDEDEDPLMVDNRAEPKGPSEVAGTSTKAAENPSAPVGSARNPDEAAERSRD